MKNNAENVNNNKVANAAVEDNKNIIDTISIKKNVNITDNKDITEKANIIDNRNNRNNKNAENAGNAGNAKGKGMKDSKHIKDIKGIIFDMDNTLISSKINFAAMKKETYEFIINKGLLPRNLNILTQTTTAFIIEKAIKKNNLDRDQINEIWSIPTKYEIMGMENALLEPNVKELIQELFGKYHLTVLTNNSIEAANRVLKRNGIHKYFDLIVGREMLRSLKPSPEGFLYILGKYNTTKADEWLSIGDAWLDGKASMGAGIKFISYNADIQKMNMMEVYPYAKIENILEVLDYI